MGGKGHRVLTEYAILLSGWIFAAFLAALWMCTELVRALRVHRSAPGDMSPAMARRLFGNGNSAAGPLVGTVDDDGLVHFPRQVQ